MAKKTDPIDKLVTMSKLAEQLLAIVKDSGVLKTKRRRAAKAKARKTRAPKTAPAAVPKPRRAPAAPPPEAEAAAS
jgi:hypothetical protein